MRGAARHGGGGGQRRRFSARRRRYGRQRGRFSGAVVVAEPPGVSRPHSAPARVLVAGAGATGSPAPPPATRCHQVQLVVSGLTAGQLNPATTDDLLIRAAAAAAGENGGLLTALGFAFPGSRFPGARESRTFPGTGIARPRVTATTDVILRAAAAAAC